MKRVKQRVRAVSSTVEDQRTLGGSYLAHLRRYAAGQQQKGPVRIGEREVETN